MITAMQMMLDDLLAKLDVYENAKMYQCVATLETSIEIAQFLLEKEKEQIKEAWYNGGINGMGLFETNTGEEYYNQTYNEKN
jgi:hypothetical protein